MSVSDGFWREYLYRYWSQILGTTFAQMITSQSRVYIMNYEHGFVVLCFCCGHDPSSITHILQGYFTGTGVIMRLHAIVPVPVTQPWRVWVIVSHSSIEDGITVSLVIGVIQQHETNYKVAIPSNHSPDNSCKHNIFLVHLVNIISKLGKSRERAKICSVLKVVGPFFPKCGRFHEVIIVPKLGKSTVRDQNLINIKGTSWCHIWSYPFHVFSKMPGNSLDIRMVPKSKRAIIKEPETIYAHQPLVKMSSALPQFG